MNAWKKAFKRLRANPRVALAVLLLATLLAGVVLLQTVAERQTDARKGVETLQFEKNPDAWLAHQHKASDFRQALSTRSVATVALAHAHPGLVLYTLKNGERGSTVIPGCTAAGCAGTDLDRIGEKSAEAGFALVAIDIDPRPASRRWSEAIQSLGAPVLLVAAILGAMWLATRLQTGMGAVTDRLSVRPETRFADVIGNAEAKAALQRVKAFIHDPGRFAKLGAVAPRGVLLVGPPGVGKTLLAKALAGESKASFIAVDGSYFTATFYGAGVNKVKALFKLARRHAPCVLFIDEIDGIGKRTRGGDGGAESELNRIINRVLVEMDGFDALDNVVVVAATNHESSIDDAMLRPGRFDMLVRLALPTLPDRQRLFELCLGRVQHDGSADMAALARMTAGASPAAIANIVNKATTQAAENAAAQVTADDLLRAVETHQLGGEVSPIKDLFTQDLRIRLAYHEAGHALVGHWLDAGRVERVTIEPRGQALGVTYITRAHEDPLYVQAELTSRLAMTLAGREAELLVLGGVSTGASEDLKQASELAIKMVGSLGFSEVFGLLSVAGVPKELLGPDIQRALLAEARSLLETSQVSCREVLTAQRPRLDAMAARLLECDVLSGDVLKQLLGEGHRAKRPQPTLPTPVAARVRKRTEALPATA